MGQALKQEAAEWVGEASSRPPGAREQGLDLSLRPGARQRGSPRRGPTSPGSGRRGPPGEGAVEAAMGNRRRRIRMGRGDERREREGDGGLTGVRSKVKEAGRMAV
jgi:hypothetical protein